MNYSLLCVNMAERGGKIIQKEVPFSLYNIYPRPFAAEQHLLLVEHRWWKNRELI